MSHSVFYLWEKAFSCRACVRRKGLISSRSESFETDSESWRYEEKLSFDWALFQNHSDTYAESIDGNFYFGIVSFKGVIGTSLSDPVYFLSVQMDESEECTPVIKMLRPIVNPHVSIDDGDVDISSFWYPDIDLNHIILYIKLMLCYPDYFKRDWDSQYSNFIRSNNIGFFEDSSECLCYPLIRKKQVSFGHFSFDRFNIYECPEYNGILRIYINVIEEEYDEFPLDYFEALEVELSMTIGDVKELFASQSQSVISSQRTWLLVFGDILLVNDQSS